MIFLFTDLLQKKYLDLPNLGKLCIILFCHKNICSVKLHIEAMLLLKPENLNFINPLCNHTVVFDGSIMKYI